MDLIRMLRAWQKLDAPQRKNSEGLVGDIKAVRAGHLQRSKQWASLRHAGESNVDLSQSTVYEL
jgi:hypothetical protein